MLKKLRYTLFAFFIGIFLSLTNAVFADVYSTTKDFGPYAGYSYYNYCALFTDQNSSKIWGYSSVSVKNGQTVPSGYMGISAYVYSEDGTCVANTPWTYNDKTIGYWASGQTPYVTKHGYNYYCKGLSWSWNGSSYSSDWSNPTPYMSF
ncbi:MULTISPECIES: hypothetical protein [Desulfitobacterium]|uniref:Uncharacterized protein n=1 Tax=Desulfitobacterium dehalogenans (strain ATCC 51507 / DSM 9161 / JW/IU-DC1) TaxID=756499 RepID=I4AAH5_DESDJ|nr:MULTISPECIES: hypothetical protein [Desulfitobacterium]AFM00960.1 hypothetical protein Desde_2641 [Desulfitobacterium dehalogenans ATCC 51507]